MKKIFVIFLTVAFFGLSGFIVYDKVFKTEEIKCGVNEDNNNISSSSCTSNNLFNKEEYTDITAKVENLDISMGEDELEYLISYANIDEATDEILLGATYDDYISNEFKIGYTLIRTVGKLSDVSFDDWINLMGNVKIKKDIVISLVSQNFSEFIYKNIKSGWSMSGIWNVICDDEYCYFNYSTYGLTGILYDGYESNLSELKVNADGTKTITAKPVYVEYRVVESDNVTVIVSETKGGKVLKIFNDCTLSDMDDEATEVKEYCTNFENYDVKKYTYTFSKDNKLVSVKVS